MPIWKAKKVSSTTSTWLRIVYFSSGNFHQVYHHNFDNVAARDEEMESNFLRTRPMLGDEDVIDHSAVAIQSFDYAENSEKQISMLLVVERICKACSQIIQRILFWILYLSFTLVEPILCAHYPEVRFDKFYSTYNNNC